jgi:hypothetical protein
LLWVFWSLTALILLSLVANRLGHPRTVDADSAEVRMFWLSFGMLGAFSTGVLLLRQRFWFWPHRRGGAGYVLVTLMIYGSIAAIGATAFLPFVNGHRMSVEWVGVVVAVVLLLASIPRWPKLIVAAGPNGAADGRRRQWSGIAYLVGAIACGVVALAIPFAAPRILAGAGSVEASKTNVPPSIAFSPSLPDVWDVLETGQTNDGTGNSASRVIVRTKDRHWIVIASVLEQRVPARYQEGFLTDMRSTVIDALSKDYGTNLVEDGFSVERMNGRRVAQFRGRARGSTVDLTLYNRTWFDGEYCIACQVYCDNRQSAWENRDVTTLLDRITLSQPAK